VLIEIFGVLKGARDLLGSHGPQRDVKLLPCHHGYWFNPRFLSRGTVILNGLANHFDRNPVILA